MLQVWFQNARAKHRRTVIKETDKLQVTRNNNNNNSNSGNNGDVIDKNSGSNSADGMMRKNNLSCMTEMSNGSPSPSLSDISTTPSLSILDGRHLSRHCGRQGPGIIDHDHNSSGSGLNDIFASTLHSIH